MKTGWLEMMQGDKHRGQYFVLFFLYLFIFTLKQTTHSLACAHKHKVIFVFLSRCSIFPSSITHILTDSSPGGRLYTDKTKPFCCLPDRVHWKRKALWEKRGRDSDITGAEREDRVSLCSCWMFSHPNLTYGSASHNVSDTNSERLLFILILTHS